MGLFYEFFAGGSMTRADLGKGWRCGFANDFDPKKTASYAANWGAKDLVVGNVAELTAAALPGAADLAWASFPAKIYRWRAPGRASKANDPAPFGRSGS